MNEEEINKLTVLCKSYGGNCKNKDFDKDMGFFFEAEEDPATFKFFKTDVSRYQFILDVQGSVTMRRKHDKADGHVFMKASSLQGAAVFINRFFLVVRHEKHEIRKHSAHPSFCSSPFLYFSEKETLKGRHVFHTSNPPDKWWMLFT
ncbi:MAG: hypothetical protein ACLT16_20230 [[Clostridium] innocuum]